MLVLVIETLWQLIQTYVKAPIPFSYDGTIEAYLGGAGFDLAHMFYATLGLIFAIYFDLFLTTIRPLKGSDLDPCVKWYDNGEDYFEC